MTSAIKLKRLILNLSLSQSIPYPMGAPGVHVQPQNLHRDNKTINPRALPPQPLPSALSIPSLSTFYPTPTTYGATSIRCLCHTPPAYLPATRGLRSLPDRACPGIQKPGFRLINSDYSRRVKYIPVESAIPYRTSSASRG